MMMMMMIMVLKARIISVILPLNIIVLDNPWHNSVLQVTYKFDLQYIECSSQLQIFLNKINPPRRRPRCVTWYILILLLLY